MPNSPSQPLPADLQNLDVHALQAMLLAERAKVSALQEKLQSRDIEIERLGLLIAKLRRMTFGRSSEKLSRQIEQLEFQLEELESDRAAEEIVAPQKQTPPGGSDKKKPARRSLPEHLPRDIHTHEPDERACPQCQGKLHYLGQDVAETLDYVPGHFKVVRHVRPKYRCACCSHIVQAAPPSRPIDRGILAPGLLAQLIVSKYA
jgi:transposase